MIATRHVVVVMSIFSFLFGGCGKQPASNFAISDKELLVRGWKDTELKQIFSDFVQMDANRLPPNFSTKVHGENGGVMRVTFPADIESRLFCWLINYVQYPKGFDLKSRTILVAGKATINSDFLPSDQSHIGRRIMFYSPANDTRYDEVFAQVDGHAYEYPFTTERWTGVQNARLPGGVAELQ